MDIQKKKRKVKKKYIPVLLILAVLMLVWGWINASNLKKLPIESLLIGSVVGGDLNIEVDGYGVLRSNRQTLLSATTRATVKEILVRPGVKVKDDTVIIKLNNIELVREIKNARMDLSEKIALVRRQKLESRREIITEQMTLFGYETELEKATLELSAQEGLVESGTVSKMIYQKSKLNEKEITQRVKKHKLLLKQLSEIHTEAENIANEQVNQSQSVLDGLLDRQERLVVKAGENGVLQRLAVELGQSVDAGQELALIGSNQDLNAFIRVSQSQAQQVKVGQAAVVRIGRKEVDAKVTRVAPEVSDGTIEVELTLANKVPDAARSEMNVDAKIAIKSLENILYIERPVNVQRFSTIKLFQLKDNDNVAEKKKISFGEDSGKYIQIISGALLGEKIILSDMSKHNEIDQFLLQHK